MKRLLIIFSILTCILFNVSVEASDTLNGAGATFPYPVYSAWAFDYNKVSGVRLNYQSIGSGGGIRQITDRTVDFGATDAPLDPEVLTKSKLLQFPAVIGGVVPVINIAGIKQGELKLDSDTLCSIFIGDVKTWNDPKIAALNKGIKLPEGDITVITRSDGSGTTAIFTRYLAEVCPQWKSKVGSDTSVKWPVGIGGKGNEGVANYVKRVNNSIGYVEYAYAKQNNLVHIALKNKAGKFVEPSHESFQMAAATGDFKADTHFYHWLINAPGQGAWPIAGATFILLPIEKKDSNKNVVKFYDWAFKNGDETAAKLVYIPLPNELKDKIRAYWKANGIY
ncbi:MAG: phosphate ABC transporter substrate-binding protein PstS [Nitrospirae bacterium]|nr:phosphate ABC transporter substrate-binding protein PstS [Nitrospirota bacterium]MBF0541639.1 phosphate ABC transporter substrate-binding protein PstS [Nitrospirota bacterium]